MTTTLNRLQEICVELDAEADAAYEDWQMAFETSDTYKDETAAQFKVLQENWTKAYNAAREAKRSLKEARDLKEIADES